MVDLRSKRVRATFACGLAVCALVLVLIPLLYNRLVEVPPEQVRQKEETKARIFGVFHKQAEAWNRRDVDSFLAGYWDSPDLEIVTTETVRGFEAVKAGYVRLYKTRGLEMGTLTYFDLNLMDLTGEEAEVAGRWTIVTSKETANARCVTKLRKFADGWKIVRDTTK